MAKKAGCSPQMFNYFETLWWSVDVEDIERLIAIATNAALENAAAECDKPNEHGFHRTCCEVQSAIRALKVSE